MIENEYEALIPSPPPLIAGGGNWSAGYNDETQGYNDNQGGPSKSFNLFRVFTLLACLAALVFVFLPTQQGDGLHGIIGGRMHGVASIFSPCYLSF